MKKILVFGATSAIAQAFCRECLNKDNSHFFLVGRDSEKLKAVAQDLSVRGAAAVWAHCEDLNQQATHLSLIEEADLKMSGIDWILIAHGILGNQKQCETEKSFSTSFDIIQSNYISQASLLHHLAHYMEARKTGVIGVLSSVAGDRGRRSNYLYGSAKAGISTYLSGLRVRLHPLNVAVITVKMGFVDTPMTASFKKGILWTQPETIAQKLVPLFEKNYSGEVYLPFFWKAILCIVSSIPNFIFKKLKNF